MRWCDAGLEYEADPRQAEKLIEELQFDDGVNSCVTPGVKVGLSQIEEDKPLNPERHTIFRALAARANYLAADRPDCQFAAKEVCRWMSLPTDLAMSALKRLARYLLGRPRLVFKYPFQAAGCIDAYSDTDWAGCPKTRKSTSGAVILLGSHILKTYASTRPTISLSSGEAEFYGVVRATGAALGQRSLFRDLGIDVGVRIWTDSSASIGISTRQGLGKLRHIDTHTLWIQERVRTRDVELRKVRGECNPADLLTKHLPSREKLDQLVALYGCEFRGGRAASAPLLRKRKAEELPSMSEDEEPVAYVLENLDMKRQVLVQEACTHDIARWPHLHSNDEIEKMFPLVRAADSIEQDLDDEVEGEHARLHVRWATARAVDAPAARRITLVGG